MAYADALEEAWCAFADADTIEEGQRSFDAITSRATRAREESVKLMERTPCGGTPPSRGIHRAAQEPRGYTGARGIQPQEGAARPQVSYGAPSPQQAAPPPWCANRELSRGLFGNKELPRKMLEDFTDVSVEQEIPVTDIKAIDLLSPDYKGDKTNLTKAKVLKTAKMLKEMTFGTLKLGALEGGDFKHSDLKYHKVSRDVQKLLQDYRSSQDITAIGTAIDRKPCLHKEDGYKWQVPENDQISITTEEAEL